MNPIRTLCTAAFMICLSGQVFADAASHAASAETFLKLAHADKLTAPIYAQVDQLFDQRFTQAQAPESKKALLQTYQAKAKASLDKAVAWDKLKPDMVKLYTTSFSEQELKDLIAFYQSPLGKKVQETMPRVTAQSAQMAQAKLEAAVPEVNKLLADMTKELTPADAKGAAAPAPAKKP
ncbi:MAG: DUF2059 domain-containing protein [Pseudomonas sp.]|uniref:DUF2059 domain-containing protein n=1 Tax=Pseudomonas sp. TaxID=306 RepID=UPI0030F10D02